MKIALDLRDHRVRCLVGDWERTRGILDIQAQEVAESPLSVLLVSRDDRVLAASGRVRALLGRDDEELVGRRARDVLVVSGAERQRLALQMLMSGGEVGGGSRHWESQCCCQAA